MLVTWGWELERAGCLRGWRFMVRTGCVGDLDGWDVMLCLVSRPLVCVRRFVCLLVGHHCCVMCVCLCVPLSIKINMVIRVRLPDNPTAPFWCNREKPVLPRVLVPVARKPRRPLPWPWPLLAWPQKVIHGPVPASTRRHSQPDPALQTPTMVRTHQEGLVRQSRPSPLAARAQLRAPRAAVAVLGLEGSSWHDAQSSAC